MFFGSISVEINNASYKMKGNDVHVLTLPSGEYELIIRKSWIVKRIMITVENDDMEIFIQRMFPEIFFGLGIGFGIMLYALYFVSVINIIAPIAFMSVFILLLMYYSLIKTEKYFKITTIQK